MLTNYENREDLKKISHGFIYFTLLIFVYVCYVTNYSILSPLFKNKFITSFILKLHGNAPNSIILRTIALAFAASAILTFSPIKTISAERKKMMLQYGLVCFLFYLLLGLLDSYYYLGWGSLILSIITFGSGLFFLFEWKKKVAEDLKSDRRQEEESQFDQQRPKVETNYSVNIPYWYSFLGEKLMSWINLINPFRGILIGGTPGSGKSFAILEEIMRQFTKKGFSGVVYDYKFPTLTRKQFNYIKWYEQKYQIPPKFYMVNFDDPIFSHRCNPINIDTLESITDAEENTKVLMMNINKTWIQKEGDFFVDSANLFTAILMWYLKLVTKKYDYDVCSFPHLVALSTFESRELLFILFQQYPDLKAKMTPFNDAIENGALEQLAGQVASAGVALAKISSPELDYILTGDDFSFDLNNPLSPKILCLGNNPDRQMVYSAPLGLILSKLCKSLNKQNQNPSMYCIDEFPTIYIRGVDNLIGTGRSNKVATILGFQTLAQVVADYGKEIADKIIRLCGSRVMGQMMDEDAKLVSETIGKQKVLTRSYNYSSSDVSENQQVAMEDIVPPYRIAQFSQGTFCGVFADDFSNRESNKIFYGEVAPPLDLKRHDDDLEIPQIYDFDPENLAGLTKDYLDKEHEFLTRFSNVICELNMIEWINIVDDTTTERKLDEFLIDNFDLNYNKLKDFTEFTSFKKNFLFFIRKKRDTILKENLAKETQNLNVSFQQNEINNFLEHLVEKGFIEKNKHDFLINHQKEIYNDVYRIIAMEVMDLKLVDIIKSNKQLRKKSSAFFTRISESDRFEDYQIKRDYRDLAEKLSEEEL